MAEERAGKPETMGAVQVARALVALQAQTSREGVIVDRPILNHRSPLFKNNSGTIAVSVKPKGHDRGLTRGGGY